jgi:histidine ammonia-lyase
MSGTHLLSGEGLTLALIRQLLDQLSNVGLAPAAQERVAASRRVVDRLQAGDKSYYGINTGFGAGARPHRRGRHRETLGKPHPQKDERLLAHAVGGNPVERVICGGVLG